MKISTETLKNQLNLHTWTGIVCGLFLFICFVAGSLTMFSADISRWASRPVAGQTKNSSEDLDLAFNLALENYSEQAQGSFSVNLTAAPITIGGRGNATNLILNENRELVKLNSPQNSNVGRFIDRVHRTASIPNLPEPSEEGGFFSKIYGSFYFFMSGGHGGGFGLKVMGLICIAYFVALLSGLILLLPTLKDSLFALRTDKSRRRAWLDTHNLLGFSSLPFHIIIAGTTVAFAFLGTVNSQIEKYLPEAMIAATAQGGHGMHGGGHGGAQNQQRANAQTGGQGGMQGSRGNGQAGAQGGMQHGGQASGKTSGKEQIDGQTKHQHNHNSPMQQVKVLFRDDADAAQKNLTEEQIEEMLAGIAADSAELEREFLEPEIELEVGIAVEVDENGEIQVHLPEEFLLLQANDENEKNGEMSEESRKYLERLAEDALKNKPELNVRGDEKIAEKNNNQAVERQEQQGENSAKKGGRAGQRRNNSSSAGIILPSQAIAKINNTYRDFKINTVIYSRINTASGFVMARGEYQGQSAFVRLNPTTGEIIGTSFNNPAAAEFVSALMKLHFGNYGGYFLRWVYFLLGLGGAALFYTGNLLWLEKRPGKHGKNRRDVRFMAALTTGVACGCLAGLIAVIPMARIFSAYEISVGDKFQWIYYGFLLAFVIWAQIQGAAKSVVWQLKILALLAASIPVLEIAGLFVPKLFFRADLSSFVLDCTAVVFALLFYFAANKTREKTKNAAPNSIWRSEVVVKDNAKVSISPTVANKEANNGE
ncbi:MAG: PepSY domain-containing protein [Cardiobacteriaceae bacterium]|nr:PepSY domain-containing protein [Cardiobacteriaceae bacterium]